MKEKYVKVPQSHLDRLEQAREDLWRLLPLPVSTGDVIRIMNISEHMWRLTHRRYEEVKGE